MIKRLLVSALLFAATAASAAPTAVREGTEIELKALPAYVDRVFVPVVPAAENTVAIANLAIDQVLEAPQGFTLQPRNGELVIASEEGERAGYARVRAGGRELTLTLVNLVPYDAMKNGKIEGYRVGEYKAEPLKGLEQYERPKGFIRLTDANSSLWVSDHYRMKDFQCKLDGTTKFLILRSEALVKLEVLQHELETNHGVDFTRFTVMSGYRTPYYNSRIGNETGYSRHLYGDAMDIYIDENGDGNMDDVNRDGRIDTGDARFILRVAEQIDQSPEWNWLKGGAGVYHANSAHGPYIHIDARGYVARWGAVTERASR
ncbi:MAG TPA: D-Ala-D-Ala carboxypeptidase family metallohydrolase [Thermoanaerobaculia bacterium]|nr:D-Ala-D-Ala carboxypeptidase family metallohydrolase [Thermoanaerobaculia bacterium]